MRRLRAPIILLAVLTAGCGDSGGGDDTVPPAALWGQFRQNPLRTGMGFGIAQDNDAIIDLEIVDELSAENPFPSAISSSPVIDADSTLYIGSEGGTLAAFEGDDDLNRVWSVTSCGACPAGNRRLGALVSTPAVHTFDDIDGNKETDIMVGSMDDAVFLFRSFPDHDRVVDESDCSVCFWRDDSALQQQFLAGTQGARVSAEFVSSPTFGVNLGTGLIAGIFIGARITVEHGDGSTEVFGKLYAVNNDGSLRWEFPRAGEPRIGAVTSSPTFQRNTIYFTTDADPDNPGRGNVLYVLTDGGNLKRSAALSGLTDPALRFSPSVIFAVTVFSTGVDGTIHAMNPDGTFRWNASFPGQRFVSSFAVGNQNIPTETPEAAATPTPTGTLVEPAITATPTVTATPLRAASTLLGVAESGMLVVLDVRDGEFIAPTGAMPAVPVEGTVVSSPALSADLFLIYGTTEGQLFTINTANGELPRFCNGGSEDGNLCTDNIDCVDGFCDESLWPILLPRSCRDGERRARSCTDDEECPGSTCARPAIRSSPAVDLDGTVYFGADDGRIYAVAPSDEVTPVPTASGAPTPTPPPSTPTSPPADTATATPTIELSPTPTAEVEPTASPTEPPAPEPTVETSATVTPTEVAP